MTKFFAFFAVLLAFGECQFLRKNGATPAIAPCQRADCLCQTCSGNTCVACKPPNLLMGGRCCPPRTQNCGGVCTFTLFDNLHCGSCTKQCPAVANGLDQCLFGNCFTLCKKGLTNCNAACYNLTSNVNHCGSCGQACTAPPNAVPTCSKGSCGFTCNSGYSLCNGACVNLQSDAKNCGSCGGACSNPPAGGTSVCSAGKCSTVCNAPLTQCGASCTNTATDASHCGSCTNTCPAPSTGNGASTCTGGTCGISCSTGTPCNGACVSTSSDPANCGSCGNVCPAGSTCIGGGCSVPELIRFDDLSDGAQVPNGYNGLNWATFLAVAGADYSNATPNPVGSGTVSPPNAAGVPALSGTVTAASYPQFDAVSLYASTTFDTATLQLVGSLAGLTAFSTSATITNTQATFINLSFTNIDTLVISLTMTGTVGSTQDGVPFVPAFFIDNFSVNLHAAA